MLENITSVYLLLALPMYLWFYANFFPLNDAPRMIFGIGFTDYEFNFVRLTICWSIGYFISDLYIMFNFSETYATSAVVHHLLIMPFFALGLLTGMCSTYHFLFLIEEISTPFGNWRWMLLPKKGTELSPVESAKLFRVGLLFAGLFFFCRCVYGMNVWYSYFGNHQQIKATFADLFILI
jgi:hypothetical protein